MLKRTLKPRAFTLIELLVVIAIIALLISVLLPALQKTKQIARTVICKTSLRQWSIVFQMYTDEYNGKFNEGWSGAAATSNWWMDAGRIYMDNIDKLRCCPTATKPRYDENGNRSSGWQNEPFAAWGKGTGSFLPKGDYGSYAINGWVQDKPDAWTSTVNRPKFWRKLVNISNGASVPVLIEAQWIDAWPEPGDAPLPQENTSYRGSAISNMGRVLQNRHNEKQNCAFADGSVVTIGLKQLWTLKWHRNYNVGGKYTNAASAPPIWPVWMKNFKSY